MTIVNRGGSVPKPMAPGARSKIRGKLTGPAAPGHMKPPRVRKPPKAMVLKQARLVRRAARQQGIDLVSAEEQRRLRGKQLRFAQLVLKRAKQKGVRPAAHI